MDKRWILPIQETIDGDLYIELSDDILEGSGFKIGDTLDWKDNKDGSYTLTKAEPIPGPEGDLYMVETISMFHIKHVVRAKSAEHAMDEVVMDGPDLKEFSQKHLDYNVIGARKITVEEYLETFDDDNAYLYSWSEDKKLSFINNIDYTK
jgi:hypothetical protein